MDDLISRQAAIDALRASAKKYTGFMEMEMYTDDDAVEAIEGLPFICWGTNRIPTILISSIITYIVQLPGMRTDGVRSRSLTL